MQEQVCLCGTKYFAAQMICKGWSSSREYPSQIHDSSNINRKPHFSIEVQKVLNHGEIELDRAALLGCIKSCGKQRDLHNAGKLHAHALLKGLLFKDIYVSTALVSMYAKCGALRKAREVFDELPIRNVVSWTALIDGYSLHGLADEALNCLSKMQKDGFSPNVVTFICILKACGSMRLAEKGKEIHAEVNRQDLWIKDIVLGNALVDMYAKCGALEEAHEAFDELAEHNDVSWNALIDGYAEHGLVDETLCCFRQMQEEGLFPNAFTFSCILKACGSTGSAEKGEEIHKILSKQGLLENDIVLGSALVDMYAKCGALGKAQEVFDGLHIQDIVCWTSLIGGYAEHDLGDQALNCFKEMLMGGIFPNPMTFTCILKACGNTGSIKMGELVHGELRKQGLLKKNIVLGNALVNMYTKCGEVGKAQDVFVELSVRDVRCWNALIAGYTEHGYGIEALKCFNWMQQEGFSPNEVTFASVIKACSIIGSSEMGEEVHAKVSKQGLLKGSVVLSSALVDLYAKCGALNKAQKIFDELLVKDVVIWTTLMAGYAQVGKAKMVVDLFVKMIEEGIVPSDISFIVLLSACSHGGLVEPGQKLFDDMESVYHISPSLEHYTCMVDLFSRAGHFDKALLLMDRAPSRDHLPLWLAVLGGCQKWVNVELGRWAFEQTVQHQEMCDTAYVSMKNIYVAAGMREEADEVEASRMKIKVRGSPGSSWWTDNNRRALIYCEG